MDIKRIFDSILAAFVTEKSKIGPVPILPINWLLIVGSIFWTYKKIGTDGFITSILITLAIFIIIVGISFVLNSMRLVKRKRFYKTVKSGFGVPSYSGYEKDSSKFTKIRWNWLHATKITFTITVSDLHLRLVQQTLNDLNSMFPPSSGTRWTVDVDLLQQGSFLAKVVPVESFESVRFDSVMALVAFARDKLSYMSFPIDIAFINERIENRRFVFDEALIEKTSPKSVGKMEEGRLLALFEKMFVPLNEKTWVLEQIDGTSYRFYQDSKIREKAIASVRALIDERMSNSYSVTPIVTFENERIEAGRFMFDSVRIDGMQAQSFTDYKSGHLETTFSNTFPLFSGLKWVARMNEEVVTISSEKVTANNTSDPEENVDTGTAFPEEDYEEELVIEKAPIREKSSIPTRPSLAPRPTLPARPTLPSRVTVKATLPTRPKMIRPVLPGSGSDDS